MRVVKVLSDPAVPDYPYIEIVRSADAIDKGEKFIKRRDSGWFVYRKSKVHLATPRYVGRFDNFLSAVYACRV